MITKKQKCILLALILLCLIITVIYFNCVIFTVENESEFVRRDILVRGIYCCAGMLLGFILLAHSLKEAYRKVPFGVRIFLKIILFAVGLFFALKVYGYNNDLLSPPTMSYKESYEDLLEVSVAISFCLGLFYNCIVIPVKKNFSNKVSDNSSKDPSKNVSNNISEQK